MLWPDDRVTKEGLADYAKRRKNVQVTTAMERSPTIPRDPSPPEFIDPRAGVGPDARLDPRHNLNVMFACELTNASSRYGFIWDLKMTPWSERRREGRETPAGFAFGAPGASVTGSCRSEVLCRRSSCSVRWPRGNYPSQTNGVSFEPRPKLASRSSAGS